MKHVDIGRESNPNLSTISSVVCSNYRLTFDVSGVAAIFDQQISIVEYRSELFVEAELEGFALSKNTGRKVTAVVNAAPLIDGEINSLFEGYPKVCAALAHQIEILSDITGCDEVGIRLVVASSPMCPAIHVDRVPLRLVWNVYGAGTEFILTAVSRDATSQTVAQANPCSLLILKGTAWGDGEEYAAKHRSPDDFGVRVVISLDPLWKTEIQEPRKGVNHDT